MKKIIIAVLLMFSVFGMVANADTTKADDGLSAQYNSCMDKSSGVGVLPNMVSCTDAEVKIQDLRLNRAYKSAVSAISSIQPKRTKSLQDAQRAWIKYRDANCNFYANPDGGTASALEASECFLTSTSDRAKELEKFEGYGSEK